MDAPIPTPSKDSQAVANAARSVAFMPVIQEREISQETIQITLIPQVGPEPWDLHILEGQDPRQGRAGKITLGMPDYPSAALSWRTINGEPVVHNIWVEADMRRHGIARILIDAFRRHVSPKVIFVGPYSNAGLATVEKLSDEVRASSLNWYKTATALGFSDVITPYESEAAYAEKEGTCRVAWLLLRKKALEQNRPLTKKEFDYWCHLYHFHEQMSPHYFHTLSKIIGKTIKDLSWQRNPPNVFGKFRHTPVRYIPMQFRDKRTQPVCAVLQMGDNPDVLAINVLDWNTGEFYDKIVLVQGKYWVSARMRQLGDHLKSKNPAAVNLRSFRSTDPFELIEFYLSEKYPNAEIEIQPSQLPEIIMARRKARIMQKKYEPTIPQQQEDPNLEQLVAPMVAEVGEEAPEAPEVIAGFKSPFIVESKRSEIRVLKDNRLTLTDEERMEIINANAVWHHGPNGEESPAVWKSKNSKGEIIYVTNTHRCYQTSKSLKECIRLFHDVVEETA